jgi:hypothetical protein
MHDKLQRAQDLLGHQIPSGDIAAVFDRALDILLRMLEKQKFAATDRPRSDPRPFMSTSDRYLPRALRHAVWVRDGGQCTFVGSTGHRCTARKFLEFDHVDLVAYGGQATEDKIRLRCQAHNQYTAEQALGAEFMARKREESRKAAAQRKAGKAKGAVPKAAEAKASEERKAAG